MGFADEIQHVDTPDDLTAGPIAVHRLSAAMELYARGEVTAQQVDNVFGLTARGVSTGFNQLVAAIDALGTENQKLLFVMKLEAAGLFYESGTIDKDQYKQIVGLTD